MNWLASRQEEPTKPLVVTVAFLRVVPVQSFHCNVFLPLAVRAEHVANLER